MKLALVVLITVLTHLAFVGARMATALFALQLGASAFMVGVLLALYAALPMFLAISAGRLIDRIGMYRPALWSGALFLLSIMLPALWPTLAGLCVAATLSGTAFMVYQLVLNNAVGAITAASQRAVGFSWLALGFSVGGFFGPLLAGFAIDRIGFRPAFALLAITPALAFIPLLAARAWLPAGHGEREDGTHRRHVRDLLRQPVLRGTFIVSLLLATGWDLYNFIMPVYGSRIGLSATTIGVIMSAFAAATFVVRLFLPMIARSVREWTVIVIALAASGGTYLLFPFAHSMPALMVLSFLLGLGLGCSQPMIMALLYAASPAGRQAEVIGLRTMMLNVSHTFLPLVMGALGTALGMGPVFGIMAACLLAGGEYARRERRESIARPV